jgi:hypothetical protein
MHFYVCKVHFTFGAGLRAGPNPKKLYQIGLLGSSNLAQRLHTRVWPEQLLIPCGVLGGKEFALNLRAGLKNRDEVFLGSNSQHGPNWAHPLDNEHLYCQPMEG